MYFSKVVSPFQQFDKSGQGIATDTFDSVGELAADLIISGDLPNFEEPRSSCAEERSRPLSAKRVSFWGRSKGGQEQRIAFNGGSETALM